MTDKQLEQEADELRAELERASRRLGPMRWAVVHRVRAGRRGLALPRLIINNVPAGVTREALRRALEASGLAAEFHTAGVAWAGFSLVVEAHWPEAFDAGEPCRELEWLEVAKGAEGGATRRITVTMPASTYAYCRFAAAREGLSLNAWATLALEGAGKAGP